MAVLSEANRALLSRELQASVSSRREAFGVLTKAQIRAAVDALDDFMNANATAINNAIPQPARAQLTTAQKAELLKLVITLRYQVGA